MRAEAREARTVVGVGGVSVQSTKTIEHSAREQGERRKTVGKSLYIIYILAFHPLAHLVS